MNVWYNTYKAYDCLINCSGAIFRLSKYSSTNVLAIRLTTDLALLFSVLSNNPQQIIAHLRVFFINNSRMCVNVSLVFLETKLIENLYISQQFIYNKKLF